MKKVNDLEGKWIQIHGYKHDGNLHRIWDSVFVIEETSEYIVVASNRVKVVENNFKIWKTREPAVMIYFKRRWYNVIAMIKETGISYYVNLASPFVLDKEKIKYIDYDLDIKMFPNNRIKVIDVNEYIRHKNYYGYEEDIDKILRYNLKEIKELMSNHEFPFQNDMIEEYYRKFKNNIRKNDYEYND
ncbi:MAG: DUF402 domain-containing protein [Bacillales bacterium]